MSRNRENARRRRRDASYMPRQKGRVCHTQTLGWHH